MLKAVCGWVIHTLSPRVCIVYKGGKGPRWSGGKEHDRSGAGNEGYPALCVGCEGSVRNVMSDDFCNR